MWKIQKLKQETIDKPRDFSFSLRAVFLFCFRFCLIRCLMKLSLNWIYPLRKLQDYFIRRVAFSIFCCLSLVLLFDSKKSLASFDYR